MQETASMIVPSVGEIVRLRNDLESMTRQRDEALERCNKLNRRLTKAEGIIAKSGIVEGRPRKGSGSLGRALANLAAYQWQACAEKLAHYVKEIRKGQPLIQDVLIELLDDAVAEFDRLKEASK